MKEQYEPLELETIVFDGTDIIITSDTEMPDG